MSIIDSIQEAKKKGANSDAIINEIIRQNPDKQKVFSEARRLGADSNSILNEIVKQNGGQTEQPQQIQQPSFLQKVGGVVKKVGGFIAKSEIALGQDIAAGATAVLPKSWTGQKSLEEANAMKKQTTNNLITKLQEVRAKGGDTSKWLKLLEQQTGQSIPTMEDLYPALSKTNWQVAGDILGTTVDLLSAGTYGNLMPAGSKSAKLGAEFGLSATKGVTEIIKPTAKTAFEAIKQGAVKGVITGGATGGAFGLAGALQDDEDLGGVIKKTLIGAGTGAVISGIVGGVVNRKNIDPEVLKQQALEQYKLGLRATKEKFKEKADKIIPELLDAKEWGTRKTLLEKADKGIKLSMEDYKKLGELKGMVSSEGLLQGIDDNIAKLGKEVVDPTTGEKVFRAFSINEEKVGALKKLKADIVALDAFDKVKDNQVYQQELRELAQFYGTDLYESRKAMKTINDSKTLSQVKKVDGAIRSLLNTNNPEYSKINEVYHRNSELYDILQETVQRESSGLGVKRILQTLGTVIGVGAGVASGNITMAVGGGVAMGSMLAILNSTWWNTLRAVQKNNLAEKLLEKGASQLPQWLVVIERQGIKAVNEILTD